MMRLILILIMMFPAHTWAVLTEGDRQEFLDKNLLKDRNPGGENGAVKWSVTGGALTLNTSSADIYSGARSLTWDPSASSQVLSSAQAAYKQGMSGTNGAGLCFIRTTATDITMDIYDGTTVLTSTTVPSSSYFIPVSLNFVFPSGAITPTIRFTSASNSAAMYFDDCYLGPAFNISQVSQAQVYGSGVWAGTASCDYTTGDTSAAYTDFPADTDCPNPTVTGNASAPSTKVPRLKFASAPPGEYLVFVTGRMSAQTAGTTATIDFAVYDGTTVTGKTGHVIGGAAGQQQTVYSLVGNFTYTTAQTNLEFRPVAASSSNSNDPYIYNSTATLDGFSIKVYYFPLSSQTGYKPDEIAWRVDANISGANYDLGGSDQTSYISMTNGSMTMTQNSGSTTVQIPCSSTNPPTGLTCGAGTEDNGVSFTIPKAGAYRACVSFSHFANTGASGTITTAFQIVETPTNAQTISQEGKSRIVSGTTDASQLVMLPHRNCGTFEFASSGQKVLRLMYEQDVTATVSNNLVLGDAASGVGQRDIHWEVYPINQQSPAPLLVNSVVSNYSGVLRMVAANLNCDSSAVINSQSGSTSDGIASIGNISGGACAVTFGGNFSSTPYCLATWNATGTNVIVAATTITSSGFNLYGRTPESTSNATTFDANVLCVGPR